MPTSKKMLIFKQFTNAEQLSETALIQMAELIFDTDVYISQAMFYEKDHARRLIPELFRRDDKMFRLENVFAAVDKNGNIKGLILWKQGPLNWESQLFRQVSCELGIPETPWIDLVEEKYFQGYNQTAPAITELIDVCVNYDDRGKGIGSMMLRAFLQEHPYAHMELFVLADNQAAIHVYENAGFNQAAMTSGFSVNNDQLLPCILMRRSMLPT